MIRAGPDSQPEIEAFLRSHVEQAMLPLSTLQRYGMTGGHRRALDIWLERDAAGQISDMIALSLAGLLLPLCTTDCWARVALALADRSVSFVLGPREQVRAVLEACQLDRVSGRVDRDEPYLTLSLDALHLPAGAGHIVPIAQAPRDPVMLWLANYLQETLGLPPNMARLAAIEDYDRFCTEGSHVVLMEGGEALSMTGFDAHQPDVVQIGGVYTPPGLRGLGLARRAVALHLAQARREGVSRAVLSATTPAAVRAYEGIGFRTAGVWSVCAFAVPLRVCGR